MVSKYLKLLFFCAISAICNGQIPTYIPLDSLHAFYPFTENLTNLNDLSTAAYNGASSQLVVYSTDRNGLAQQAIQGTGYIDLPGAVMDFDYSQSFTVSFWCTKPANANQSAALFSTAAGGNYNFEIDYDGSLESLIFQFGDPTYSLWAQLVDTNWHQYTYVYNHAIMIAQLYVDGEILSGTPIFSSQNLQYGAVARFGAKADNAVPTIFFSGKYDDFGLWRRVLNPCEISSIYNDQFQFSYLSAGPDINICAGQEAILGAQNATQAFWNNGVINGIPFSPSTGYYVLTGLDYNECPGTDSLLLTVIPEIYSSISIISCDPVSYYDLNLVNSGSFQTTITAVSGCDSIVNIDFQRLTPPLVSTPSIAGSFLVTDQSSNYAYQWFTCSTNTPISGANAYLFEAPDSAFYYVVATNSCGSDTTDCYSLYPDASTIDNQPIAISVYPNPAHSTLCVSGFSKDESNAFQIFDEFGKIISQGKIENQSIHISTLPNGYYLLKLNEKIFQIIKVDE